MGVSGHAANLPCSLDPSVCFCYVSRATIAHSLYVQRQAERSWGTR